jgi:ribosomal protein S18 acetylase RimI-like enzyme
VTLRVRPATGADEEFLRRTYAAARADEVAAFGWPEAQVTLFLAQQFDAQRAHYRAAYPGAVDCVVEAAGEPVGRLYVDRGAEVLHVLDLALLAERRSRGIGTFLLRELQADAAAAGLPLRLSVERTNRARALYDRLGLRPTGDDGVRVAMEWTRPGQAGWAAAVGSTATIRGTAGEARVELAACAGGPDGGPYEQFTLRFRGPADGPAAQDTYRLEHPGLGTLDVFLVPTARTADHVELSASFALLRPTLEAAG